MATRMRQSACAARARPLLFATLLALASHARANEFDDNEEDPYSLRPSPPPPPVPAAVGSSSSSCVFKAASGEAFDLRPMKQLTHDFTGTTSGGYTYRFNVCENTVRLCNAQPAPASKWRGTKCNNLGDPGTQTVSLLSTSDPSSGLRLKYTQGDICKRQVDGQMEIGSRMVNYEIFCDRGEEGKLRSGGIKEESMCEYTVQFDSKYACPTNVGNGPLGGRGWKLIFFILFGAVAYLGVGIYLNGRNEGKHGVEAIPHIRQWEEVPSLVKEGLQFSYTHGKVYGEVGRQYAEVGFEKGKALYHGLRSSYQGVPSGGGAAA